MLCLGEECSGWGSFQTFCLISIFHFIFSSRMPLWPHSSAAWSAIVPSFPTPLTRVRQWLHLKIGFKVHIGWTQLATSVAVETRLMHGQVVENRVSGSLRGYRGLSRFMDFTAQFDRPSGNVSSKRGKNIRLCADTAVTRRTSPDQRRFIRNLHPLFYRIWLFTCFIPMLKIMTGLLYIIYSYCNMELWSNGSTF